MIWVDRSLTESTELLKISYKESEQEKEDGARREVDGREGNETEQKNEEDVTKLHHRIDEVAA